MIQLRSVKKQYSGQVLFEKLDWHIPRDGRIGLVGPNGAGKTTLMRILAGEEACDEGGVQHPRAITIGYLPQDVSAPVSGSVLVEVLEANAELRRMEAKRILGGLGFVEEEFHAPVSSLSGGFRMRVALSRLLLAQPDLLLLDEPTNHLDLESLVWLEEFMTGYPGAVIVASHDRFFLNRMVAQVAEIDRGRFTLYPGNYDDYVQIRHLRREQEEAKARQQARRVEEIERFINRFRAKASKARQVQSRIKMLEKMDSVDLRAESRKKVRLSFPQPPRSGAVVMELRGLVKRYGEKTVYDGVDFSVARADKLALVGPNGAGKTTLLRVLAGVLPFEDGTRREGHNVSLGYYAQHQLESLDPRRTVLEEVLEAAPDPVRPRVRSLLGLFLFSGDDVDKRIAVLSGGEKARVALCKMLLRPVNLLLLDEPTNHLDLHSREVLEEALQQYAGTIVLISHDRYFINRIASKVCEIRDGSLEMYVGDYDDYTRAVQARAGPAAMTDADGSPQAPGTDAGASVPATGQDRRAEAGRRKAEAAALRERKRAEQEERRRRERAARPIRERLKDVEEQIAGEEKRREEVLALQADPHVYADGSRAREIAHERRGLEERLAYLYDEWAELTGQLEDLLAERPAAGKQDSRPSQPSWPPR
jgi:ATP-binding cassette subfamily F protein 3